MNPWPMKKFLLVFLFLIIPLLGDPLLLRSETAGSVADTSLSLSDLAVPEEIGKVQERFNGGNARTIIQIQDVHAHAVAQQNIAAILERLRTVFGIKVAALEGAWVSTSLPKSHAIPTSREKQLLAGTLLDDDLISGPVYAAIMSPDPILLAGIEKEALYEKNRAVFLEHLNRSSGIQERLRSYGKTLEASQSSVWGPGLLAFGYAFGKFRETTDLGKFFPVLLKTAENQGLETSDLSQIKLLRDTMALEKSFSKEKLEQEVKSVMREYKNTSWTLEELIRGGKIPAQKLGSYPEIKKLNQLYKMRDQLSLQDLTAQIETLTGRILGKLVKTPEESALWEKTERYYLARRILLLQATPADMSAYEEAKLSLGPELEGEGLSVGLTLSLDFYETVKKRDQIFFDRITSDPALAGNIAIVTGGFHTDGLSQKFRDAGISYITITPDLGGASMNEKLYEKRMSETTGNTPGVKFRGSKDHTPGVDRVANDQTLSELQNRIAQTDRDFPPALIVLKATNDLRRSEARFIEGSVDIPVSKTEQIEQLTTEKRIRKNAGADTVTMTEFRQQEFMALPRAEQLSQLRQLMERAMSGSQRSMLVSSIGVIGKMLPDAGSVARIKGIVARGDILALLQDVPVAETPEALLSMHGIEKFQAADMDTLLRRTPTFLSLARQRPFVIMKNGYQNESFVVVDEDPVWLDLFPVLTLSARLYESARNPAFLELLKSLYTEALSKELAGKSV